MLKSNHLVSYGIAFTVNLVSFAGGACWGWASPAIPRLKGDVKPEENPLAVPATVLEISLIASLCHLGAVTGPWISTIFTNRIGRKKTLLYSAVPMFIAHSWICFATRPIEFCIARFLMGVSVGIGLCLIPMYISELAEKETRGSVGMFLFFQSTFCQLIVFSINPFVSLRFLSYFTLIPTVLFFIFFTIFVPESPYYFVLVNQVNLAEESLKKLRRKDDVKCELREVIQSVEESRNLGVPGIQDLFKNRVSRKAFVVAIMLMFCQQGCLISPIFLYLQTIFDRAGTVIPGDITAIIAGAIAFGTVFLSTFFRVSDKVNRKTLLILSELIVSSVLFILGLFFYLQDNGYNTEDIFWVPVLCVVLYFSSFNFGMGPVAWQIVGEIFPANVRALGTTICTSVNVGLGFTLSFLFPIVSDVISISGSFWIFSVISILGSLFIYFVVPETRNKSLLEIQRELRGDQNEKVGKEDELPGK